VNETVDAIASEIESSEEKTKKEWIDNHAVIDSDGRARCSSHFYRKLFKDEVFLKKHLPFSACRLRHKIKIPSIEDIASTIGRGGEFNRTFEMCGL